MHTLSRFAGALSLCIPFLTVLIAWQGLQAAEKVAAFSMSMEEFSALSPADQKALVASAFQRRLEHAKNIHYEALHLLDFVENEAANKPAGKVIKRLNGNRVQHWVLGESYRVDTARGGPDVVNPVAFAASNFDAESGVARSTGHRTGREGVFGRIDTKPVPIDRENFYARWLDGDLKCDNDSLPRYLVKYSDEFMVELPVGETRVRLSVPWHYYGYDEEPPRGTRVFSLDPEKGFLPVHGVSRWELLTSDGKKQWRSDEFFVEESRLVVDVWMPTKLKWVIESSSVPDTSDIYHVSVEKIDAGAVTAKDLEIVFEPGMYVVDRVKGETFFVGDKSERTRVEPLLTAAAFKQLKESAPHSSSSGANGHLIWLVLGNLVLLAGIFFVRQAVKRGVLGKR